MLAGVWEKAHSHTLLIEYKILQLRKQTLPASASIKMKSKCTFWFSNVIPYYQPHRSKTTLLKNIRKRMFENWCLEKNQKQIECVSSSGMCEYILVCASWGYYEALEKKDVINWGFKSQLWRCRRHCIFKWKSKMPEMACNVIPFFKN